MNLTLNLSPDLIHLLKLFLTPSVNSASNADRSSSPGSDVSSKPRSPLTPHRSTLFPRITKAAYDAGKAESVEADLRSASVSAPKLIKTIRFNESMGYLNTQNLSSAFLYRLLDEHFGLSFQPRCFRKYRSKVGAI
ncbi:MAG: hypothetical protein IK073_00790 [Paludibacteraceae bacterium]|nr:hypothetical protein [Paludibacteraceae bacterium]